MLNVSNGSTDDETDDDDSCLEDPILVSEQKDIRHRSARCGSTYWLTRVAIYRAMGLVYLVAFLVNIMNGTC